MNEEDRDQQILHRLARIQHKIDSLEQTQAFALRAEAELHIDSVKQIFGRSKRKAQVYLAADGLRSVGEIGEHLNMKPQNVSTESRKLYEEGLLEISDVQGHNTIYAKTPIDRTIRIGRFLMEHFSLSADGLDT